MSWLHRLMSSFLAGVIAIACAGEALERSRALKPPTLPPLATHLNWKEPFLGRVAPGSPAPPPPPVFDLGMP